mmetsp:Transcript_57489/g.163829  ORF Transcript_57489/g.163829 Transcript_57489/m.163829 type:complete len:268 (+) Transcript_57489:762-1565(+)
MLLVEFKDYSVGADLGDCDGEFLLVVIQLPAQHPSFLGRHRHGPLLRDRLHKAPLQKQLHGCVARLLGQPHGRLLIATLHEQLQGCIMRLRCIVLRVAGPYLLEFFVDAVCEFLGVAMPCDVVHPQDGIADLHQIGGICQVVVVYGMTLLLHDLIDSDWIRIVTNIEVPAQRVVVRQSEIDCVVLGVLVLALGVARAYLFELLGDALGELPGVSVPRDVVHPQDAVADSNHVVGMSLVVHLNGVTLLGHDLSDRDRFRVAAGVQLPA